jgi:hypothetical protein
MGFIAIEASMYYHFHVKWYLDKLWHQASASFVGSRFKVGKVYAVSE